MGRTASHLVRTRQGASRRLHPGPGPYRPRCATGAEGEGPALGKAKAWDGSAPMSDLGPPSTGHTARLHGLLAGTPAAGSCSAAPRTTCCSPLMPALVAYLSQFITREPGDLVFTGTPAGVWPMAPAAMCWKELDGPPILSTFNVEAEGNLTCRPVPTGPGHSPMTPHRPRRRRCLRQRTLFLIVACVIRTEDVMLRTAEGGVSERLQVPVSSARLPRTTAAAWTSGDPGLDGGPEGAGPHQEGSASRCSPTSHYPSQAEACGGRVVDVLLSRPTCAYPNHAGDRGREDGAVINLKHRQFLAPGEHGQTAQKCERGQLEINPHRAGLHLRLQRPGGGPAFFHLRNTGCPGGVRHHPQHQEYGIPSADPVVAAGGDAHHCPGRGGRRGGRRVHRDPPGPLQGPLRCGQPAVRHRPGGIPEAPPRPARRGGEAPPHP